MQGACQNQYTAAAGNSVWGQFAIYINIIPCKNKLIAYWKQIERLRYQLSLVQNNEAFLLHAGDCAESFDACTNVQTLVHYLPNTAEYISISGKYIGQDWTDSFFLAYFDLGSSLTCGTYSHGLCQYFNISTMRHTRFVLDGLPVNTPNREVVGQRRLETGRLQVFGTFRH